VIHAIEIFKLEHHYSIGWKVKVFLVHQSFKKYTLSIFSKCESPVMCRMFRKHWRTHLFMWWLLWKRSWRSLHWRDYLL